MIKNNELRRTGTNYYGEFVSVRISSLFKNHSAVKYFIKSAYAMEIIRSYAEDQNMNSQKKKSE